MHSALIGLFLLAQPSDVPDVGQRVVAEMRNGYRIEGVLIEKDGRSAVLSLESGELRLDLKRVRRFHVPEDASTTEKSTSRSRRLRVEVPLAKAGGQRLSFSVPEDWKTVEDESATLAYVGPGGEMRFRVEESAEVQSLWKITARIRRGYKESLAGFEVKQERFGNRWTEVRTWEIDFEYTEGENRYRERRLYLDFGPTKKVFVFRTRASNFPGLIGHFERITSDMALERPAAPPASPDASRTTTIPEEARIEELEQALEAELKEALEG